MAVDLHVHSTASDGEHSPTEVVRRAAAVGLSAIALTDHDTLSGVAAAREAAVSLPMQVIGGCEFSVAAPWGEMHLLAYFLPEDDAAVQEFLDRQRGQRTNRAHAIVDRLNTLGVAITAKDVLAAADGAAVGRPHVARALIAQGAVATLTEAFDRYLGWGRAAFVPKELPALADVTTLVREAGGVTSAAHLKGRATTNTLRQLKQAGVDGVEVLHPAHDAATVRRIRHLADSLDLLATGGSDWHGETTDGFDRAPLGSLDVPDAWLEAAEQLHVRRFSG